MIKNVTQLLAVIVVGVCAFRFLLDGITLFGVYFDHIDPLAYGSILSPVLLAHGYVKVRSWGRRGIDDPDQ